MEPIRYMVPIRFMVNGVFMKQAEPQLKIRIPSDLKKFIAIQAERNKSSQNSEIVRCIRERMDRQTKTATE